ncbi:MAG: coenzyme F420-0:L-glutamate ligase [Chloroflexi bacterium]|nr:coenzyme F420-0:L-glutamate ligase [Chloroflexota bacterium]
MLTTAVKTPRIEIGQALLPVLLDALPRALRDRDILCVTSKVVALEQSRCVKLADVVVSEAARSLPQLAYSKDFKTYPGLAQLILDESDSLFQARFVYVTLRHSIFIANAGIDLSNVPDGYAVLWPRAPWQWARAFRDTLRQRFGITQLGIVVTDSHVVPFRRGVLGIALAWSGFEGVESQVGKPDLYGKPLRYTEKAVADDLATASILVSGESDEATPFVLHEDVPATFTDRAFDDAEYYIAPANDLYAGIYAPEFERFAR